MVHVVIDGEPKAKARPRMNTRTGRTYTPKDTIEYENWVKLCYKESNQGVYLEGLIRAIIITYHGIPKSFSKKKHKEAVEGKIRPTKKPDVDNMAKSILDALNGVAYKDDSQVVDLSIEKYYGEIPRVELVLREIKGENHEI